MKSLGNLLAGINGPFVNHKFNQTKLDRFLLFPFSRHSFEISDSSSEIVLSAANVTFKTSNWAFDHQQRRKILTQIAETLERNSKEIALIECENMGKPLKEALADVSDSIECFRFFSGFADKLYGRSLSIGRSVSGSLLREPIGPCALITSFNYPLLLSSWKLAPALAAGNTCILKPHEDTPLSVLYLAHLIASETDMEKGIIGVLTGGPQIGKALCEHLDIQKVSFTGSLPVGRKIMGYAASSNLKKVTLELGGKSPLIVFDDVKNVDSVVGDIIGAIFSNAGQNCCAGSRLYIQRGIHDTVLEKLKLRISKIASGDPSDMKTEMGPLVNETQFKKVTNTIKQARNRNIPILCGSRLDENCVDTKKELNNGWFVKPTVFYDVPDTDPLAQEEIFGPVLSILSPFETEEEVIKRANENEFGLGAGVWTSDTDRVLRMQRSIQAGTIWINCYNIVHSSFPFGGWKSSGVGTEMGPESVLHEYSRPKTILQNFK